MNNSNNQITDIKAQANNSFIGNVKKWLSSNMVTCLFSIICLLAVKLSGLSIQFVINELIARMDRNLFLVISLIIPIIAGMGLNFGIVIGAIAGQIAIIAITHWKISGILGFLLCVLISTPLAVIFGISTGKILNKTKGQEMITGMILGFFTNGLYQFLFLFLVGTIIPMKNPVMILNTGIGIKNTVDLTGKTGIAYALDNIFKLKLPVVMVIIGVIGVLYSLYKMNVFNFIFKYFKKEISNNIPNIQKYGIIGAIYVTICIVAIVIMSTGSKLNSISVPILTFLVVGALCFFNSFILKTKLGQDFRTVGQDMSVAKVSGINVDRTRIIAIVISTVLAAWGQLIFLQNMGTLNTYGSHEQVGMFAVAAILIGGASVSKATIGQAIIGTALFHILFTVSPQAGKNLFGDAQIGEYFRAFVAYGIIGVSLGLHAWRKRKEEKPDKDNK